MVRWVSDRVMGNTYAKSRYVIYWSPKEWLDYNEKWTGLGVDTEPCVDDDDIAKTQIEGGRSGFRSDNTRQEENGKSAESNENHTIIVYTSVWWDWKWITWPN